MACLDIISDTWTCIMIALNFVVFLFDLVTDCLVAEGHIEAGNYTWFALTILFMVLPYFTMICLHEEFPFGLRKYIIRKSTTFADWLTNWFTTTVPVHLDPLYSWTHCCELMKYISIILFVGIALILAALVLPLLILSAATITVLICVLVTCVCQVRTSNYKPIDEERCPDKTFVKAFLFIEAFAEAAPQLILQLYIILSNRIYAHLYTDSNKGTAPELTNISVLMVPEMTSDQSTNQVLADIDNLLTDSLTTQEVIQLTSIVASLSSLTWTIVKNSGIKRKFQYSWSIIRGLSWECLTSFLTCIFVLIARIGALVLFLAQFPQIGFVFVGVYVVLMSIWVGFLNNSALPSGVPTLLQAPTFAFLNLFVYTTAETKSMFHYHIFYTQYWIANFTLIMIWYYLTPDHDVGERFRIAAVCVVAVGFFLGPVILFPFRLLPQSWCDQTAQVTKSQWTPWLPVIDMHGFCNAKQETSA